MLSLSVTFGKRRRGSLRSPLERVETGGKGIRTPDLLIANETLYQLSYTPVYLWKSGREMLAENRFAH